MEKVKAVIRVLIFISGYSALRREFYRYAKERSDLLRGDDTELPAGRLLRWRAGRHNAGLWDEKD